MFETNPNASQLEKLLSYINYNLSVQSIHLEQIARYLREFAGYEPEPRKKH